MNESKASESNQPEAVPSETPIFTKTSDFLDWLVTVSNHFPKLHRQTITRRLVDAALDFQDALIEADAVRGAARLSWLGRADAYLNKVRHYLRLVHRLQWINIGQYKHGSRMVNEVGRLLGGWQKITRQ